VKHFKTNKFIEIAEGMHAVFTINLAVNVSLENVMQGIVEKIYLDICELSIPLNKCKHSLRYPPA
jgi:hypothetical protein